MTRYGHLITDGNRKWWTLGAMCFALFMVMLDNTVVNVALPSIQRDLGASISGLEWVVNGYTLSFAVLLATAGRLGDIFGRRRCFLIGVTLFTASSIACGMATTTWMLVVSRVLQGVGAAFMMPGTLSIITNAFEPAERGKAIGIWAGVSALALAIGPVIGGFLTEHVSWQSIFFLNVPVGAGAVVATLFAVRESRDESVGREVDLWGVATITVSLTAFVLALIEGNAWGWTSPAVLGLFAIFVVFAIAFNVVERTTSAPMIELPLFRSRDFVGANVVAFVVSFAMLGMFFFLALYMQDVLGFSPLEAGVRFLPSTLMIMFLAPIAGRLTDRVGPRWLITAGLLLVSSALYLQTRLTVESDYGQLLPIFLLMGAGMALTMSPMSTAAMNAVPEPKAGVASGLLSMNRMVGGSVGIAVLGALFQAHMGAMPDPSAMLSGPEAATLRAGFVDALAYSTGFSAALALFGAICAAVLIRGGRVATPGRGPRSGREADAKRARPTPAAKPAAARGSASSAA